jgi:YD repeat-containing protein
MRGTLRSMTLCMVFSLAGLAVCLPSAWAGRSASVRYSRSVRRHSSHVRARHSLRVRARYSSSVRASSLVGSLVVPGGLEEGQQVGAAAQAKLANPEAAIVREVSASSYEGLSAPEAEKVAQEAFPALIDEPSGGPPSLPEGQAYHGFVDAHDARVDLGGGEQGILESLVPMATEGSSGSWAPVDLGLQDAGNAFEAVNPLVAVRLPKRLSEGAQIPGLGLFVTPITSAGVQGSGGQGSPLGGSEGTVDGASVFYANTQTDSDTIAKPSTYGFSLETLLRSARSPDELSFQVGLPSGASLVAVSGEPGGAQVVKEGVTIAQIPSPSARDAAGTPVPLSMSVSGDTLTLSVAVRPGDFEYPIAIDPEFNTGSDSTVTTQTWEFAQSGGFTEETCCEHEIWFYYSGSYSSGTWGELYYRTNGDSRIYKVNAVTMFDPTTGNGTEFWATEPVADYLEFENSAGFDNHLTLPERSTEGEGIHSQLCAAETGCSVEAGAEKNLVRLRAVTTKSSSGHFQEQLKSATVSIAQPKETHSTVSYNTSSPEIEYASGKKTPNVFNTGGWIGPNSGAIEFKAKDLGLGVARTEVARNPPSKEKGSPFRTTNFLEKSSCKGVQCEKEQHEILTYASLGGMPNGESTIRVSANDAIEHTSSFEFGEGEHVIKVDSTPPHGITLSGLPSKGEEFELGEVEAHIKVEAADGEAPVPSSGIKSITLGVEGKEIGKPSGYCAPGPCTASGEWSINGAELGVGSYTLTAVATDNAGNVESENFVLNVYHASPVGMGPGSVNPESGDFALGATDVNVSGGSGSLAVTRHYDSRNLKEGEEGPLGPQWTLSLGSLASLEVLSDGSVMSIGAEGLTFFKIKTGGGFESPKGDTNLTLEAKKNSKSEITAYLLKDSAKGTTTEFTLPSGAKLWMPTVSEGPVPSDTTTDAYETVEPEAGKKIVEPKLEIAPHPSVTCTREQLEKLEIAAKGCRGLEFVYGTATKAKGEKESEWGEYKGRLKEVKFIAYNPSPSTKAMAATGVAKYEYDSLGRLRAEWNPEISPALRTVYGYDAEGHVTALTSPGRESWAFTYGTIAGDATTGRLIKATQAPASAKLWGGEAPNNTEAPKLSGSPMPGIKMGVTNGVWSNEPVAYAYQWEDCNSGGKECTTIVGATNENYRPVSSDVGHTLVAQVSATNGGGTVSADTLASNVVKAYESAEYALAKESKPDGITTGPDGNLWFTDSESHGIVKMAPSGKIEEEYSLPEGYSGAGRIITGPEKEKALWFTFGGGIGKITTSGTITEYKREHGISAITVGPDGNLWFVESTGETEYKIVKMAPSGKIEGEYAIPLVEGEKYYFMGGITVGPEKENALWFTLRSFYKGFGRIGKITTSGTITEYALPFESAPSGITVGPDGNLWFTEGEGPEKKSWVGKITTSGTATEYSLPEGSKPLYITAGSDGNLWFTESGASKVGKVTTSGTVTEYAQPAGSDPNEITVGPDNNLWFTDYLTSEIGKMVLATATTESEYSAPPSVDRYPQVAAGPDGNVWVTDWWTSKIWKMTTAGKVEGEYSLPHTYESWESAPAGITPGPEKENALWFTDHDSDKIGRITTSGEIKEYALPLASAPYGIVAGPEKEKALWFTDFDSNKIGRITTTGEIKEYKLLTPESAPVSITLGRDDNLWFAADYTSKIGRITPSGEIKEYPLPANSRPLSIVAGPDGNLWFTEEESSKIGMITPSGTITEYAVAKSGHPWTITTGPDGNLWFTLPGDNKIGQITTSGIVTEYAQPTESAPWGIATGPDGNVWFADYSTGKLAKVALSQGESHSPQPGWTVEYNAPLEGSEAPDQLGVNETTGKPEPEKWDQKDDPVYATAVFPPDEPQSWPATNYKRATVDYMDSQARTVNTASPSGGISTREYNSDNEVERTLRADNRATALKEAKPAEAAELLSTKSAYSEGQLIDTWGPQHMVKLAVGKEGKIGEEVLARNHVKYYYDEEAPVGEKYDLVTKTVDGAETASKEEFDERTATTSYSGQSNLGWTLRMPTSETTDPGGLNLTSTTKYEESTGNVTETTSPASKDENPLPLYSSQFGTLGSEGGEVNNANAVTVDPSGNIWVSDAGNNRIEEFSSSGVFIQTFGWGVSTGSGELQVCKSSCKAGLPGAGKGQLSGPQSIAYDSANSDLYVSDGGNNRIVVYSTTGSFVRVFGEYGKGEVQFNSPHGLTFDSKGDLWVADQSNSRLEELSAEGKYIAAYGKEGKGNLEFSGTGDVTYCDGNLYATDYAGERVEELSTSGTYIGKFGAPGKEAGQFTQISRIACDTKNNDLYVTDKGANHVDVFTSTGSVVGAFGGAGTGKGQFNTPIGVALNGAGTAYVMDNANNRIQEWALGNPAAHDTKTIYYTAKTEAEVVACREHPEWTGLPCETKPVAQPGTSELPELPVTTVAYNMWDQPEKITEEFGSVKRTKTTTYGNAGQPLTSEETSSIDQELPKVTDKYNKTSGALEEQSTTVGATTKMITSKYNALGQLETYTDADGNTATFEYEKEKDARLIKMSDGKGSQTYHYDETTGALKELVDSSAGTFTAEYDVGGKMTSESYPNGMTAYYTHNQAGEMTGIEYKKLTHCTEKCVWFSDTAVPSIHGETMKQASSLSEEPSYTYDTAGRLTQVQEIPAGEGCKTRFYSYDEDSNRTTETTREPGTEGKCATEGGSTEWHTYDTANTLSDPGVTYEKFGNTTKLPAADADGSELTSEYYVDGQVYKQEQGEQKLEYKLDPEERTRETVSKKGGTESKTITHYDSSDGAVAWTSEGSGEEKWTRNIPGIGGALTATQEGEGKTGKPVVLLLHDLSGDVVAEAAVSETETKLLKTYNSTEFGVPSTKEAPPKYAWLGATGVAGELSSGVITQDGVTYVPITGRPLQTEGVPLPSPENAATPFSRPVEAWVGSRVGEGVARELGAAQQKEEEREAANQPPGAIPIAGEWEEGGGEEEGGGGGCSGMSACAASFNPHHHAGVTEYHERGDGYAGCSVWASYGSEDGTSGISGEIEIDGHWKCNETVTEFEVQTALLIFYEGSWVEIGEPYNDTYFGVSSEKGDPDSNDFQCGPEHADYDAWVFGRQYDGSYHARWWSWGQEAEVRTSCHGGVSTPETP